VGNLAKAYGPVYLVTKGDVNTFLSESNRKDKKTGHFLFSYRLLIATTDRIGPTPRNTMNNQAIDVGHLGVTHLEAAEINWPASPSDLRARRMPPTEPLDQVGPPSVL
jgi:predicted helicase